MLAACGGDDDGNGDGGTASEAEAIALAEWLTRADSVCDDAEAELTERTQEFIEDAAGGRPSPEALEDLSTEVIVPALGRLVDDLRALPPPDQSADRVTEMLDSIEEGTQELEDDPALINTEEGPEGITRGTDIATDLGLQSCGDAGA